MTVLHDNLGNPIDAKNPLPVDVSTSDAIVPTDIQSHLQTTIQTHNAVSVALSGWSTETPWHDSDGFDKIAVTVLNDGSFACKCNILWSNDGGTTKHGEETVASVAAGVNNVCQGIVDTKSRYFRLSLNNQDSTLAHTMSAYVYLKA